MRDATADRDGRPSDCASARAAGAQVAPAQPARLGDDHLLVAAGALVAALVPAHVTALLDRLAACGHAAYLVGGSVRDATLQIQAADWDIATDARPERLLEIFQGSHYENRFGTVVVPAPPPAASNAAGSGTGWTPSVEVTTFRRDHEYGDHRRPDRVTFSNSLDEDLARRDFTVNALAWGSDAPVGPGSVAGRRLVDRWSGLDDVQMRLIRCVGDPEARFAEDALRLVRAARLAGQLDFAVEPATLAAMIRSADLVRHVSSERVGQELRKLLRGSRPSRGLRLLSDTGILERILPELAAQRGLPQDKAPGQDCWDHTLGAVDAAAAIAPGDERLGFAALLHDAGKPAALEGGRFPDHGEVGARIAERILRRLAIPRREADPVVRLVRLHMFNYVPEWSDAAVRRFIQRAGTDVLDDVFRLRAADSVGSGGSADDAAVAGFRVRVATELERGFALDVTGLAVNGEDLKTELGLLQGPIVGRVLARLLDSVTSDPSRNTRRQALVDARSWLPEMLKEAGR
jgi:tRNA nucleotidyltransferase (CCA-adding enzyme)